MVIFFDIDGTLLNQRQAELTAARQIVRVFRSELPVDISTLEVSRKWRRSREKYLPAWLNGNISYAEYHRRRIRELFDAPEMTDHAADVRYESFHQAYRGAWTLYSDVFRVLPMLSRFPLGVISNGNAVHQRQKLSDTGILDAFSIIVVSEEVHVAKPSPEIFVEAAHRAGCNPADCVFVGDHLATDIWPCRTAGMQGIWLNRRGGFHDVVPTIQSLTALPRRIAVWRQCQPA